MDLTAPHSVLLVLLSRGWLLILTVRSWRRTGSFASVLFVEENLWHLGMWSCVCTISTGTLLPCLLRLIFHWTHSLQSLLEQPSPSRLSPSHLWLPVSVILAFLTSLPPSQLWVVITKWNRPFLLQPEHAHSWNMLPREVVASQLWRFSKNM